jgi:hypothetical protein
MLCLEAIGIRVAEMDDDKLLVWFVVADLPLFQEVRT